MQSDTWIAVDWGTSNLRLWAVSADGEIIKTHASSRGMGSLAPDEYEAVLLELASDILEPDAITNVLICGMAGAKQGWIEAPYMPVPCAPAGNRPIKAPTNDPRLNVHILSGLCQIAPPNVMRGEETQIAGYLSFDPDFEGMLCLPGTHSKWAHIADGKVQSFESIMTGELFALLSKNSVLRHSMHDDWDDEAFLGGVRQSAENPSKWISKLFAVRAADLISANQTSAKAHLSGLLIGAELCAIKENWLVNPVKIIGAPALADLYVAALSDLGCEASRTPQDDLSLHGLKAAYLALKGTFL